MEWGKEDLCFRRVLYLVIYFGERRSLAIHDPWRNEDVEAKNSWLLAQQSPICALSHVLHLITVSTFSLGKIHVVFIKNAHEIFEGLCRSVQCRWSFPVPEALPKNHTKTYNCKCSAGRSDLLLANSYIYINPYFLYTLCHMAHGLLPLFCIPCFLCICSCSDVLLPSILSVSGCSTQPLPVQLEAR